MFSAKLHSTLEPDPIGVIYHTPQMATRRMWIVRNNIARNIAVEIKGNPDQNDT